MILPRQRYHHQIAKVGVMIPASPFNDLRIPVLGASRVLGRATVELLAVRTKVTRHSVL